MPTTVVVGASRGIGYQFIQTLALEGNTVIATARNVADLEGNVKADKIPNTHVVQADLTSADSLIAAAKATSSLVDGQIDHLLINGAFLSSTGGMNPTDFADKPELFLEELKKSVEANIAGPLFAINAFLPLLRAGKEKRVTYISTGVAYVPETIDTRISNSVPYSVSKAGGNMVIAKFAAELQDEGFTFLSIAPGGVATEAMTDMSKFTDEEMAKMQVMLGRMMQKYPEWKGLISPEECVKRILNVVKNSKVEQSGQFLSYWGNTTQWL
ncbi:NAD(P)-binding protein [Macroventuria anomochaeta]|uniref:NAD(P)-binding protein n=1 Tax=Macroventuria anomochaeta TaxID=301207 RepID=A0ACB6RI31_9PLEO|nr:NAD(P)-binding protein [Macroventuria anomochaeta]KAF2621651.1 NAD(P)-binding protein [Macroventuria anomochaeta]